MNMTHAEAIIEGKHAVIIGASMAGLLAGRVASDHFERVTIIERDPLPAGAQARKGVPQGRHAHGILSNGSMILEDLFPGLFSSLIESGAVETDAAADFGWYQFGAWRSQVQSGIPVYCLSRPLLESRVRERLATRDNVTFRAGYEVAGLCGDANQQRITGVRVRRAWGEPQEEELIAELVVDASGRGSQAPQWLTALGYPQVPETAVKVDVGYVTRIYRRPNYGPQAWKAVFVIGTPPEGKRLGAIMSIEDNQWIVTLVGSMHDYPPSDEAGFLEFARSLEQPDIYDMLRGAEPLTPIATYKFPANRRRHYERMARVPEGFIALGDAACSFNPIYGQGMTVAAMEAKLLKTCLQSQPTMTGLARRFQKASAKLLNAPWQMVTTEDLRYPEVGGKRSLGLSALQWYLRRVLENLDDPKIAVLFCEVSHMLKPPTAFFKPYVLGTALFKKRATQAMPQPRLELRHASGEVK